MRSLIAISLAFAGCSLIGCNQAEAKPAPLEEYLAEIDPLFALDCGNALGSMVEAIRSQGAELPADVSDDNLRALNDYSIAFQAVAMKNISEWDGLQSAPTPERFDADDYADCDHFFVAPDGRISIHGISMCSDKAGIAFPMELWERLSSACEDVIVTTNAGQNWTAVNQQRYPSNLYEGDL